MRRLFRVTGWLFALFLGANFSFAVMVAYPGWAFPYKGGSDRLRIHALEPVPETASAWADEAIAAFEATGLPLDEGPYDIYIADRGWQAWLYFLPARGAGGVVYPFNNAEFFISGADFGTNRLIKDGTVITPPRTLVYYAVHELSHLSQMQTFGRIGYLRMPSWVREGVADYVALGPASDHLRAHIAALPEGADRLPLMIAHGAYPEFRQDVTDAIGERDLISFMADPPQR